MAPFAAGVKNKDFTFYPYFLAFPIAINQPCKVYNLALTPFTLIV
jgi:hypothetical protein